MKFELDRRQRIMLAAAVLSSGACSYWVALDVKTFVDALGAIWLWGGTLAAVKHYVEKWFNLPDRFVRDLFWIVIAVAAVACGTQGMG